MLFIYKYVGARSRALSDDEAVSTLSLRRDLRGPNGPKAAALAVLMQDLAGVTLFPFAPYMVPIQINVRIRPPAMALSELAAHHTTLRRGRTVMASEVRITDPADADATVAFGTVTWATGMKSGDAFADVNTPEEIPAVPGAPEDGDPDLEAPSMLDAIGAVRRADGKGWELTEVAGPHTEPVALGGESTGTLHAGALQILQEGAATLVAASHVPEDRLMIEDLGTQFLAPARVGPISAIAETVLIRDDSIDCRVELREQGGAGRLSALTLARFRILD